MYKATILVVDDEKEIVQLLKYNLNKEGFNILTAETGEKGLESAVNKKPDLIILDLMLPTMDGLEVCRVLKSSQETKNIPVVMLTAKNSEIDQIVGLEMGAEDYLSKPFSPKVLLARIRNVLRKRNLNAESDSLAMDTGPFSLDSERVRFSILNKPVKLTKIEFKIIGYLMKYPDIVISRERLIAAVWGEGSLVSSTALNMHLTSLRKKLGKYREAIETVRGTGFRFKDFQVRQYL